MKRLEFEAGDFRDREGAEACWKAQTIFDAWYAENVLKYTDEIAVLKDKIMRDMLIMGETNVFLTENGVEIK